MVNGMPQVRTDQQSGTPRFDFMPQPEPPYRALRHEEASEDLSTFTSKGIKFGCIYADPAWQYDNQATRAATDNHYQTMGLDTICGLPVKDIVAEDAHLHLWTTNAFLFDSMQVMEAWGFTYKSVMLWIKPQIGLGNYWRVCHEFLLLGVRGSAEFRDHSIMSWRLAERTAHSSKPEVFRQLIERVSPGPYLEMFGRVRTPGWSVWGNQIATSLFDASAMSVLSPVRLDSILGVTNDGNDAPASSLG